MTDPATRVELDAAGPVAPPRHNGELVFETPWESRLFGITMALHRAELFEWEEFKRLLIDEIAEWEAQHASDDAWSYYACWQRAFEKLVVAKGFCPATELSARTEALAARPPGHDH